jgi:PAH dioxygenase large subunit
MRIAADNGSWVNRAAFGDPEVLKRERERVFRKSWLFLGHESEIPKTGDYVTRHLAGEPVIVVRDKAGDVRVLLNTCRHRGAMLCHADMGNVPVFYCSYHGWTYDLDGDLRGVPMQTQMFGPNFNKNQNGLVKVRSETFHGLVFGCWDNSTPSLRDWLGDAAWYLESCFGKCDYKVVGPPSRIVSALNWKTGCENYGIDFYHIPITHASPVTMGVYGPQHMMKHPETAKHLGTKVDVDNVFTYRYFTTPQGHGGGILHLPMEFAQPTFLGYEEHLWPEFTRRLGEGQLQVQSGLNVLVANLFPNCSYIESLNVYAGDDMPPVRYLHMRVWHPVAPDRTEMLSWTFVPTQASTQWQKYSPQAYLRALGTAGSFEIDDYRNWLGIAASSGGAIGQQLDNDYSGGLGNPSNIDRDWPGTVKKSQCDDIAQRGFYTRWQEMMA